MSEDIIDHDAWPYAPQKSPKASAITLDRITGVLPFDGKRNPGFRSATSHRVWLTYKTPANDWQPKVAICESGAEAAVVYEAFLQEDLYDIRFQPFSVSYEFEGRTRNYTHDLLVTFVNGHRRLFLVRNWRSLSKPKTWREIGKIAKATPAGAADDMIVVNASDYSRQRRENLFRMQEMVQHADDEADEAVFRTAQNLRTLWLMEDLFEHVALPQWRVFRACYRLIARKKLTANMDHVIHEKSRVAVAA